MAKGLAQKNEGAIKWGKKMPSKLVYQDWIVALAALTPKGEKWRHEWLTAGLDCDIENIHSEQSNKRSRLIKVAVRKALSELTSDEQEILESFYFMGESYMTISERSGREVSKLNSLCNRALKKLRKRLTQFAEETFGIPSHEFPNCLLCQSPRRKEIDIMIHNKQSDETWREIIKELRADFGIVIIALQILIGHEKYHG